MWPLVLAATRLPQLSGPSDDGYHGRMPVRALYAAPDAATSVLELERDTGGLVYTDFWRGADASLVAVRTKSGTKPPGYSAHGYGLSFDLHLTMTLKRIGATYVELIELLADRGWYCHRRDLDSSGAESWHFNWLGLDDPQRYLSLAFPPTDHRAWSEPIELRIQERYGAFFRLELVEVQRALRHLALYGGEIDGIIGPLSREAIATFQRAWNLTPDGMAGPRTMRTLAYVTAERRLVNASPS